MDTRTLEYPWKDKELRCAMCAYGHPYVWSRCLLSLKTEHYSGSDQADLSSPPGFTVVAMWALKSPSRVTGCALEHPTQWLWTVPDNSQDPFSEPKAQGSDSLVHWWKLQHTGPGNPVWVRINCSLIISLPLPNLPWEILLWGKDPCKKEPPGSLGHKNPPLDKVAIHRREKQFPNCFLNLFQFSFFKKLHLWFNDYLNYVFN